MVALPVMKMNTTGECDRCQLQVRNVMDVTKDTDIDTCFYEMILRKHFAEILHHD
jgi:hypothetical protein